MGSELSYVAVSNSVREPGGKHTSSEGVELDLPGDGEPGALEPEVEAADAREQASDAHVTAHPCGGRATGRRPSARC